MREYLKEKNAKDNGEGAVLAAIAKMKEPDRSMARRVHALVKASATGSKKVDVTGGMHTKLEYLYNISGSTGATCEIINGNARGRLYSALSGFRTVHTIISGK